MIDKKVTDDVFSSIGTLTAQKHELGKEIDALTEKGCVEASLHWRDDKYLYLLYPVTRSDGKRKSYIGVDPKKQQLAKEEVERWKEREALREQYGVLSSFIEKAEEVLSVFGKGLDAFAKKEQLDYQTSLRFDRIMGSVSYGW